MYDLFHEWLLKPFYDAIIQNYILIAEHEIAYAHEGRAHKFQSLKGMHAM